MDILDQQPSPKTQEPAFTVMEVLVVLASFVVFGGLATMLNLALFGNIAELLTHLVDNNTLENRSTIRLANMINHLFTFSLAGILSAIFLFRNKWSEVLRLNNFSLNIRIAAAAIVWILVAMPFVQFTYWLNKQLPLPESAILMEEATKQMLGAILTMDSPLELAANVFILAFLPALGEEILFRGFLVRWFQKWINNPHVVVWVTAFLFSALHFQFEGFLPRFLLGGILGYLFIWTRNLWVPIITHFVFNGLQVVAAYFMENSVDALDPANLTPNWLQSMASLICMVLIAIVIKKNIKS